MTIIFFIGRIIFGLYWLKNAYNHFKNLDAMADYAHSKSVIYPKYAVGGTGLLLLIGGLSILTGYLPHVGIICLLVFLLSITFVMHAYWKETDPMMRMSQRINFEKNIALLAALLMMTAIPLPWPLSL